MIQAIPKEYLDYLRSGKPNEGFLSIEPGYFQLWPEEDICLMNTNYKIDKNIPGYIGFGSNGGEELFVFNNTGNVFAVPFIGMENIYLLKIADSWSEFTRNIE